MSGDVLHSPATFEPARSRTSLASLADVELQLCLQSLDNRSRVMTARCCRQLLQLVSHPFVWRAAEPLIVEDAPSTELVSRLSSAPSLVRFAPVLYRAPHDCGSSLSVMASLPMLTALDLRDVGWEHHSHVHPLLQQPDTQRRLRRLALSVHSSCSEQELAAAVRMPALRTLSARVSSKNDVDSLRTIACADTLRHLQLTLYGEAHGMVLPLDALSNLQTLHAVNSRWTTPCFARMLMTAPRMCSSLRSLTLDWANFCSFTRAAAVSTATHHAAGTTDLAAAEDVLGHAFASMPNLNTLQLLECSTIDALLPSVSHLPALRLLVIQLRASRDADLIAPFGLSASAVESVLQSSPLLHLRFDLQHSVVTELDSCRREGQAAPRDHQQMQRMLQWPRVSMRAMSHPIDILLL